MFAINLEECRLDSVASNLTNQLLKCIMCFAKGVIFNIPPPYLNFKFTESYATNRYTETYGGFLW